MLAGMCGTGSRQRQGHNFPELLADITLILIHETAGTNATGLE